MRIQGYPTYPTRNVNNYFRKTRKVKTKKKSVKDLKRRTNLDEGFKKFGAFVMSDPYIKHKYFTFRMYQLHPKMSD